MATVTANLAVPANNGVGAAVDVSTMDVEKTLTIQGAFTGVLIIEGSNDGGTTFGPLRSVSAPGKVKVAFSVQFMRVRRRGVDIQNIGTANVDVSAQVTTGNYSALTVPAVNGVGAALDISAYGDQFTFVVAGAFAGAITIEISEDLVSWNPCLTFAGSTQVQTKRFTGQRIRVRRSGIGTGQPPGNPVVAIGAVDPPSGGGGSGGLCLVYQQGGGETGPVVFGDWDDLIVQLLVIQAANPSCPIDIIIDDSVTSPSIIPSGGPYDMTGVTLRAPQSRGGTAVADSYALLNLAEGSTFTNLRSFAGPLSVVTASTATTHDTSLDDGDTITVKDGARLGSTGASSPIWSATGLAANEQITLDVIRGLVTDSDVDGTDGREILDIPVTVSELIVNAYEGAQVEDDCISGVAGAVLLANIWGSSAYINDQANFSGTRTDVSNLFNRFGILLLGSVEFGGWTRFDTSGGPAADTLPAISAENYGMQAGAENIAVGGVNITTLTPAGADTIDGVASPLILQPGESVILMSDGVSNWIVIAFYSTTGAGADDWNVRGPFDSTAPPAATVPNDFIMCDVSVATFSVPLPQSTAANKGKKIAIKKTTGGATIVTLTPTAGTVEGAATYEILGALTSVIVVSDGAGNWMVT